MIIYPYFIWSYSYEDSFDNLQRGWWQWGAWWPAQERQFWWRLQGRRWRASCSMWETGASQRASRGQLCSSHFLMIRVWELFQNGHVTYHPPQFIWQAWEKRRLGSDTCSLLLTLVPHRWPCRWATTWDRKYLLAGRHTHQEGHPLWVTHPPEEKFYCTFSYTWSVHILKLPQDKAYLARDGPSLCLGNPPRPRELWRWQSSRQSSCSQCRRTSFSRSVSGRWSSAFEARCSCPSGQRLRRWGARWCGEGCCRGPPLCSPPPWGWVGDH